MKNFIIHCQANGEMRDCKVNLDKPEMTGLGMYDVIQSVEKQAESLIKKEYGMLPDDYRITSIEICIND